MGYRYKNDLLFIRTLLGGGYSYNINTLSISLSNHMMFIGNVRIVKSIRVDNDDYV